MAGTLFVNTNAGSIDPAELDELRERAAAAGVEIVPVEEGLDIAATVRAALSSGRRLVIAAGGDGTVHHVMQALIGTEGVLAILPLGTFNHFAKDLELPDDWRDAFDVAVSGESVEVDTASINGRYFINNVMLGIYPSIVRHRETFRSRMGKLRAYVVASRIALRSFPQVSLTLEAPHHREVVRTQWFAVSVNPYDLSGFGLIATRAALRTGRLSVYWLPPLSRPAFVASIARYLRGKIAAVKGFRQLSTTELKVDAAAETMQVVVDGELLEMTLPLRITTVPSSLLVRLPERPERRLAARQ
jgi:diacylglycerol kinase family enzyme